mgnify:CR=1 FL=1
MAFTKKNEQKYTGSAPMRLDIGTANEKQSQFFASRCLYTCYGGARGGGKSWALRRKLVGLCLRYPGICCIIIRRSYAELEGNHVLPFLREYGALVSYSEGEKTFYFENGSVINLGYCSSPRDSLRYQGQEFDIIAIDEATQLQEMWIKKIVACCRGVNSFPKRIYYTCNPGGVSHGYFKRIFIDRKYEDGENPEDYTFIQALVTDNKALMAAQPDYIKQLEALPPKLREAWLYGRWDIFEGQFFEDFRETPDIQLCAEAGITPEEALAQRRFTHVIEPFEIPSGWPLMRSYDFGYNKPFSLESFSICFN